MRMHSIQLTRSDLATTERPRELAPMRSASRAPNSLSRPLPLGMGARPGPSHFPLELRAPGMAPKGAERGGSLRCQALNLDPVLQALPAMGGAAAGAVVGVPAAVIAALVVTGLSKMADGSLNKDDKVSLAGLTATVGVEALVLMAHMSVGAVVSCALVGRPTL